MEWVSVKDKLPTETKSYIVCTSNGAVYTAKYYCDYQGNGYHISAHWAGLGAKHITHWMEFPALPEED